MPSETCNQRGLSGAREAPLIDGEAAFVAGAEGTYRLEAALIFATVPMLRQPGVHRIASAAGEVQFDLERVPMTDSAGLALLIDWLAEARARQRTLRYLKVPEALSELAKLSDVEELITPPAETLTAPALSAATTAARSP